MSKSDPDNAIFMEDSAKDVERKINKAFCIEGVVKNNAVLEFINFFVFRRNTPFVIKRESGEVIYESYEQLEKDFEALKIKAKELKRGLIDNLNLILEPVRKHFEQNLQAKQIFELTKKY